MTDSILINLSIISKIELDDKIYINDEGYSTIENSTIFQGIVRFVFRNSRNKTINSLNNFYNSVFNYIDNALPNLSKDKIIIASADSEKSGNPFETHIVPSLHIKNYGIKTLLIYLKKSITGLENLRHTYSSDIVMNSKLDIILDNVKLYSDKLEKKIQTLDRDNFLSC